MGVKEGDAVYLTETPDGYQISPYDPEFARQMEMAREFGLDDYRSPASGCLLTDPGYSHRLKELMDHGRLSSFDDLNLLRVGRHFRLDDKTKAIVGRNESDNELIMNHRRPEHAKLEALDIGSPITLLIGNASEENILKAAQLTARYSSARDESEVAVEVEIGSDVKILRVCPADGRALSAIAAR